MLKVACHLPVAELGAQGEVVGEEVLLRRDGPVQTEEGVVLHTGLPQVLTGPVVDHVKTQQRLPCLVLGERQRDRERERERERELGSLCTFEGEGYWFRISSSSLLGFVTGGHRQRSEEHTSELQSR